MLNRFTINFYILFLGRSLKSLSKSPLAVTLLNLFRYLNTSMSCICCISLLKADEFEVLESLAVAVIPDFCNHLGRFRWTSLF